jgi:hypothetical protein
VHIVVATTPGREAWVKDCLESIGRPALVISDFSHEIGKIRHIYENTSIDRFLFLHDTCQVKDQGFFDLFDGPESVSVSNCPGPFGMYLGVYTRQTLAKVDLPVVRDREHAIALERTWCDAYANAGEWRLLFTDFTDGHAERTEVRHGRINLRLENDYLIKLKGTWR